MPAETQSVQIANPKHVSQLFKMSWKTNFETLAMPKATLYDEQTNKDDFK